VRLSGGGVSKNFRPSVLFATPSFAGLPIKNFPFLGLDFY
jgi:hypothetical protein